MSLLQSDISPGSQVRLSTLSLQQLILMFGKSLVSMPDCDKSRLIHVKSSSTAEQTLSKYILPLPKGDDEVAWTEQLVVTARHLDHSKLAALIVLSNIGLSYDA